jgi:hypothetical protein
MPVRRHRINHSLSLEQLALCADIVDFGLSSLIQHHRESFSPIPISRRQGLNSWYSSYLSGIPKPRQPLNDDLALIRTFVLHLQNQQRYDSENDRETVGCRHSNKSGDVIGRVLFKVLVSAFFTLQMRVCVSPADETPTKSKYRPHH